MGKILLKKLISRKEKEEMGVLLKICCNLQKAQKVLGKTVYRKQYMLLYS